MENTLDCLFCRIVSGEIPCHKLDENEKTLAFLDVRPVSAGHTLVIPKKHCMNMFDAEDETVREMISMVRKVTLAIKKSMGIDQVNFWMNNGEDAGQMIFHAHMHIIPRHQGDGHKLWPGTPYPEGEADEVAETIKSGL